MRRGDHQMARGGRAAAQPGSSGPPEHLLASFVDLVNEHRGRLLTEELATELVAAATLISSHIAAGL